jgi:2-polyprenyl-3-methyl-5-hydroxy-6-metoxy-1,4-benzoquinol methylase
MRISPEYMAQQKALHDKGNYGIVGEKYARMISGLWVQLGEPRVLDYGCGQATLSQSLAQVPFDLYDPCIEQYSKEPEGTYDLITCTDVLEHIEPDCLTEVLQHISALSTKMVFFQIATGPAAKTLEDGRNAHLIQERVAWWINMLDGVSFDIQQVTKTGHGFVCVCVKQGVEL